MEKIIMTLYCSYCEKFQKPKKQNKLENFRICQENIKVTEDSKICKAFQLAPYFMCHKLNFRTSLPICLHRRHDKTMKTFHDSCKRCRQYTKEIKELICL